MRPHKKMEIWEEIMILIENIYSVTSDFPKEETYGIVTQIRRAAVSITSNIAEGCARSGKQEKIRFFTISRGSLSEIDAQLEISLRLNFIKQDRYNTVCDRLERVSRMLQGLINSSKKWPDYLITQ